MITYIENEKQLELAKENNFKEVIICPKDLSRFGKLSTDQVNELAKIAKKDGLNVYLEFDILPVESIFEDKVSTYKRIDCRYFDAVRVQDIGVFNYFLDHEQISIHLILEGSNHNLLGIKTWEGLGGDKLTRFVLSIELSKSTIADYAREITKEIELLVLGRILLFYTPRNLLSTLKPQLDDTREKQVQTDSFLEALGESEESPHKGFPLVENTHGTFMFHIKRLNLLPHLQELKDMGVKFLRFDFRFDEQKQMQETLKSYESYSYDSIKGFFNINKSDVLFKKLKNYRTQRHDQAYIGEIVEISSKSHMVLKIKEQSLRVNDKLNFITPDGKEKVFEVKSLRDSALKDVNKLSKGQLAILTYQRGVTVRTQAYLL